MRLAKESLSLELRHGSRSTVVSSQTGHGIGNSAG